MMKEDNMVKTEDLLVNDYFVYEQKLFVMLDKSTEEYEAWDFEYGEVVTFAPTVNVRFVNKDNIKIMVMD